MNDHYHLSLPLYDIGWPGAIAIFIVLMIILYISAYFDNRKTNILIKNIRDDRLARIASIPIERRKTPRAPNDYPDDSPTAYNNTPNDITLGMALAAHLKNTTIMPAIIEDPTNYPKEDK